MNGLFHPAPFAFSILDALGIGHKKPRAPIGSSKKLAREAEQLELAIETLETDQAERFTAASRAIETTVEAHKPARRSLPEDLPKGRQASRALRLPDLPRRVAPNRRGRDRDPRFAPGRV